MVAINQNNVPKVIGLTGGVGSGKSTVATFLGNRTGIEVINADEICRQLLKPNEEGWCAIKKVLDARFFVEDQSINRSLLRKELFDDQELRLQINNVIHPLARRRIKQIVTGKNKGAVKGYVVEVPLLFEAGWEDDFDAIVVVYAKKSVCLQRLMGRDGLNEKDAAAMLNAQWPMEEKILRADYVIDNSWFWADTCLQILRLEKILWQ